MSAYSILNFKKATLDMVPQDRFAQRVFMILCMVTVMILLLGIAWYVVHMLLVLFAGILLSIFLCQLSIWIGQHTKLNYHLSLGLVCLTITIVTIISSISLTAQVLQEANQLIQDLTVAVRGYEEKLREYDWAVQMFEQWQTPSFLMSRQSDMAPAIFGVFSSVLSAATNAMLILFIGVYLAISPGVYYRGFVKLFPLHKRARIEQVLQNIGRALQGWLFAQLASMAIIGGITMIGLALLGIRLWFILGLLAAVLTFIPNIGPILSFIPPVLLALNESPLTAAYVAVFYLALQTVESYLLTPLIQQRAIALPPVLIVVAQVLMGIMLGIMGLAMATPLVAALMVAVQMLYLEDVLGDQEVTITGPKRGPA